MAKNRDNVFCVDSDGCAMDTMTYKHQLFFGPIAADEFGIEDRDRFLTEWNSINLYSRTRGVNRFVGLVMGLDSASVKGIDRLRAWVETTKSLSTVSLEAELSQHPSEDLQKALNWSNKVNHEIKSYGGDVLAFNGVRDGLAYLQSIGQVYVVSSANKEAVEEEWKHQGLLTHIDGLYCQDYGKKEDVLATLIEEGHDPSQMLMIGDSSGDLAAAEQNKIAFYPILVGHEAQSWRVLTEKVANDFASGQFNQAEQEHYIQSFWTNLDRC